MFRDLPDIIRKMRKRRGENQAAFAAQIGVDQSTVSQYETGKLEPSRSVFLHLQRLAETDEEKQPFTVWLGADEPGEATDNVICQIRVSAGMGIAAFAEAIKISQFDLSAYESGQDIPPPAVIRRLQHFATAHGRADLALILSSDEWKVKAIFHPGETFITTHSGKPKTTKSGVAEEPTQVLSLVLPFWGEPDFRDCVQALAQIWDSGDAEIKDSLTRNCRTFARMAKMLGQVGVSESEEFERRVDAILGETPVLEPGAGSSQAPHGAVSPRRKGHAAVGGRPLPPPRK